MAKRKHPKIVYVEWVDAVANNEWTADPHEPHVCWAVGFVQKETKDYILLAATYGGDTKREFNASISIPKGWIRDRQTLKLEVKDG